jgi:hypothetical protein
MFHTIFLDLYGVLFDFHTEAARMHQREGMDLSHIHQNGPEMLSRGVLYKNWPVGQTLQKYLSNSNGKNLFPDNEEFMRPTRTDPTFWKRLLPYTWNQLLVGFLKDNCKHLCILSHSDWHPHANAGARHLLNQYGMQDLELITISGLDVPANKWRLVAPDSLLIDDYEKNINAWMMECQARYSKPGNALVFPQPWNVNYQFANNPLAFIKRYFAERNCNAA